MSFPIIPGSRGGGSMVSGEPLSAGISAGAGGISAGTSATTAGPRDPQRIRIFMDGPARAEILIACKHALQNWSSSVPGYQDADRGCSGGLVSSCNGRAVEGSRGRPD